MLRLWSKVKSGQLGLYSSICLESVNVRRQVLTVERKKTATNARPQVGFICAQLLNKLSKKVPVAQVLKEIERALKPEQPGLSSSICLEVIRVQRWVRFFSRVEKKAPPPLPQKPISTNLSPFIMSWDFKYIIKYVWGSPPRMPKAEIDLVWMMRPLCLIYLQNKKLAKMAKIGKSWLQRSNMYVKFVE